MDRTDAHNKANNRGLASHTLPNDVNNSTLTQEKARSLTNKCLDDLKKKIDKKLSTYVNAVKHLEETVIKNNELGLTSKEFLPKVDELASITKDIIPDVLGTMDAILMDNITILRAAKEPQNILGLILMVNGQLQSAISESARTVSELAKNVNNATAKFNEFNSFLTMLNDFYQQSLSAINAKIISDAGDKQAALLSVITWDQALTGNGIGAKKVPGYDYDIYGLHVNAKTNGFPAFMQSFCPKASDGTYLVTPYAVTKAIEEISSLKAANVPTTSAGTIFDSWKDAASSSSKVSAFFNSFPNSTKELTNLAGSFGERISAFNSMRTSAQQSSEAMLTIYTQLLSKTFS